ncbi:response regulator transcription factor [Kutzneria viridogrisea]|nr:DNA-binding NarL/FixJ family response regulator [Kutzneria viridogrisea]
MVNVVIADGHLDARRHLSSLLDGVPGMRVAGTAGTGREAVREVVSHRTDVLVVDLQLREHDGFTTIREVRRTAPGVAVLVRTELADTQSLLSAVRAGALGYLLDDADENCLIRAIGSVADGCAIFCPRIASRFTHLLVDATTAHQAPFPELTDRESQVLELLASGMSNPAIARTLRLAAKTVGNHNSAIFTKLGVTTRAEAIRKATQAGIGRTT